MHERRFAWALLATVAVSLAACASGDGKQESMSPVEEARMGHPSPEMTRPLDALDAAMSEVAMEPVWSHRILGSEVAVEGAWLDEKDLFVLTSEAGGRALHRIEADSGVHRWVLEIGDKELSQPPGFGETYVTVVTRDGGIQAVSRRTGARGENILWGELGRVIPSAPVVSSGDGLFVPSDSDNRLHSLDPNTGASGWHWRTDGLITSGPVVTPRVPRRLVVVGTSEGEVVALPPHGHDARKPDEPAWERMVLGEVTGPMSVASHVVEENLEVSVLVPCEDNGLYCLDAATGGSRWVYRTAAPFRSRPLALDGLVIARNLNRLAVVDLATGTDAWKRSGADEGLYPFETYSRGLGGSRGRLYLAKDGTVARVSRESGHVEATADLGATFAFVPGGGTAGLLVGIAADGGIVAWR